MRSRLLGFAFVVWVFGAPAHAQVLVLTQPAAPVRATNATLNGMVDPNFRATMAWFDWGTNTQYGNSTDPVAVGSGYKVVRVSAPLTNLVECGVYHFRLCGSNSLGVTRGFDRVFTTGMRIQTWGSYSYGRPNIPGGLTNLVGIAAGHGHCLALRNDGTVVAWMAGPFWVYPNRGQTNVPPGLTNVVALAGGFTHSLALNVDGTVVSWGGYGDGTPATNVPAGLSNVIAIAAGDDNSLALKSDGTMVAWGNYGAPIQANVMAITCGSSHTLALATLDGSTTTIAVSGSDPGSGTPPVSRGVADVVTEGWYNLAILTNGTVAAWGSYYSDVPKPTVLTNAIAGGTGYGYAVVLKADGTLVEWGRGVDVTNLPPNLSNVVAVTSGDYHCLALAPGNLPPIAYPAALSGGINRDLTVTLPPGFDPNGDPLTTLITVLPSSGRLFQYTPAGRGDQIIAANTVLTDPLHAIFVPDQDGSGVGYGTFQFCVNDGLVDSPSVSCAVSIVPPPAIQSAVFLNGGTNAFSVGFTGLSNGSYSVLFSTNLTTWISLGHPTENPPGQFLFLDYAFTNSAAGFYKVTSP